MRIEYFPASFAFGRWHMIRGLYKSREHAQALAEADGEATGIETQVLEVDIDDPSSQPEEIRDWVAAKLELRTRTIVQRVGQPYQELIRPGTAKDVTLSEGDTMIKIDLP